MSVRIKVCGMREPDNILEVSALSPEFMGFIFYLQSPRCVEMDFEIPHGFPSSVKKVGVFVNEEPGKILDTVNRNALDFVQLHGDEPFSLCEKLKLADIGVIKVFLIDEGFDFKTVNPYKPVSDYFLFDAKGKLYGGNASTFNWNLLQQYDQEIPFFLSGGISPDNVQQVLQLKDMNLYGVDVNSGVEISPGVKDVDKIKELLKNLS